MKVMLVKVIPQCEVRPPLAPSSSIPVSKSVSISQVYKLGLADLLTEGSARTKKMAKEPGRQARKSSSAKAPAKASVSSHLLSGGTQASPIKRISIHCCGVHARPFNLSGPTS